MPIFENDEIIPTGIPQAQFDFNDKIMRIEWNKLMLELYDEGWENDN